MSLDYDFYLQSDGSVDGIADAIREMSNMSANIDESSKAMISLAAPGVRVTIRPVSGMRKSIISDAYGFTPNLSVTFIPQKFDETGAGYRTLIDVSMGLLSRFEGDAVLLFNGETPLFLRNGQRLIVNGDAEFWRSPPAYLARLTLPFELGRVPSL